MTLFYQFFSTIYIKNWINSCVAIILNYIKSKNIKRHLVVIVTRDSYKKIIMFVNYMLVFISINNEDLQHGWDTTVSPKLSLFQHSKYKFE